MPFSLEADAAEMAANVRSEVTRSGPAEWGWLSTTCTRERNDDPTEETVPAAVLSARTDRSCRPTTGTMVTGANSGDDRSDWALVNSVWASSRTGPSPRT